MTCRDEVSDQSARVTGFRLLALHSKYVDFVNYVNRHIMRIIYNIFWDFSLHARAIILSANVCTTLFY